jgi:hypothetical protein
MTESQSTTITAAEFWQELQSQNLQHLRLVMPAGALVRSVPIVSIEGHYPVVELSTAFGERLSFTASDNAEIKRIKAAQKERIVTQYDVTFPLGDYFTLIIG